MKLNRKNLSDMQFFQKNNIYVPNFNQEEIINNTKKNPIWIHFGTGNIFKAFIANLQQELIEKNIENKGIIVAEGFDYEIIEKINIPNDNLSILVTLKSNGDMDKKIIASIVESLKLDRNDNKDFARLKEIFSSKTLQIASFTITEKGYSLIDTKGEFVSVVAEDFTNEPDKANSYIGKLANLCYHRFLNGAYPIALVSMDNISSNGDKLFSAVRVFAEKWEENNLIQKGFLNYIENKISFPWTMIDKITPRPDENVMDSLKKLGLENIEPIITKKNTYVAPFVNAEETEYLVIEDNFPNGRPKLEKAGVLFTDRDTVKKVEQMKVTTCLNPLHTALAIFGCLLGYKKISDEMKDKDLKALIGNIGYIEGLPVVVDPKIISPKDFLDTVINIRLPNPFIPDTPQRIATDTSQKLGTRFGETIKSYLKDEKLDVKNLENIPLTLAAWCRYLMGIDDNGEVFEISPDPLLAELVPHFSNIKLGENISVHEVLKPILSDEKIFGLNLYDAELGEKVEKYFKEMILSKGAIAKLLKQVVNK